METAYEEYGARPRRSGLTWLLAPLGVVGLLGAGTAALRTRHESVTPMLALNARSASFGAGEDQCLTGGNMPHKFALPHITPVALQMQRGGCWMFSSVALLEYSYRQQGLAKGWLHGSQYLKMSEQAFGVAVLDACRAARAAGSHACVFDGDRIYTGNSTEGGEVAVVYYLSKALSSTAALPWSTCPYTPVMGEDRKCDGLAEAQKLSQLDFVMHAMNTYYERIDTKKALLRTGRMFSLSMPMANVRYLLPCTRKNTHNPAQCGPGMDESTLDGKQTPAMCEPCPLERAFVGIECCVASDREMHTMGGEFFFLPDLSLQLEGGHAVAIVGYSDTFETEHGHTGGWIIKNSWWDGMPPNEKFWNHARGSHSVAYFMQTISDTDEAALCPNSHSPRSWYPCNDLKTCRSAETALYARASKRALRLQCLDRSPFTKNICQPGDRYFLKHLEPLGGGLSFGGGLTQACLVYDDPTKDTDLQPDVAGASVTRRGLAQERIAPVTNGGDLCTPPLPVDDLAMIFGPVPEEDKPNDPDVCGFYFMPYAVLDMLGSRFGGWFATDLDLEWSEASYAASAASAGATRSGGASYAASYELLTKDTYEQRTARFPGGPFPNIQRPL